MSKNKTDNSAEPRSKNGRFWQSIKKTVTNVRWLLVLYDFLLFVALGAVWSFIYTRMFDVTVPVIALSLLLIYVFVFLVRLLTSVYRLVWRYGGVQSYIKLCISDSVAFVLYYVIERFVLENFLPVTRIRLLILLTIFSVYLLLTLFMRMVYRYLYKNYDLSTKSGRFMYTLLRIATFNKITSDTRDADPDSRQKIKIAIVGAGTTGVGLAVELKSSTESPYFPVLFIDVSTEKIGRLINGIPVISEAEATPDELSEYEVQEIVLALPHISEEEFIRQYSKYSEYGVKVKSYDYPRMQDAGRGRRLVRELDVEELLFRRQTILVDDVTSAYYKGKTVLITGGGGSIGSELCRRLAKMDVGHIIILDIYENGAYDIQQELKMEYGAALKVDVEIISVCSRDDMERVIFKYRPDIVLHAAAHKHVPLMEHNCVEAVKNNVFGTLNVVELCEKYEIPRFIMISTDKAVNPTNVMGATKRLCEQIILSHSRTGVKTKFSATRFGNVLGSNGSVIPLFHRQIAKGGPVTITDKRIIRYFMTIPEASQLVLCSGAIAKNGELFVLDMGRPVRIYDLALNMIKLNGLVPGKDIEIVETGLRPGEKLYEELLVKDETLTKTANEKIFIEVDNPLSASELNAKLAILRAAVDTGDDNTVKAALRQVVTTYHDPKTVNNDALRAEDLQQRASASAQVGTGK